MDPNRWERIQEIFHHVSDLPRPQQGDYLEAACRGDESLHAELTTMLEKDARGSSILDGGLPPVAQSLLEPARSRSQENR
jgi:hypothetical protein